MSEWTGESIVDGFPRASTTYWIQFITEPEIITKEGQYGGTYKQALIRLQFFMPDEFGEYHYAGWGEKKVQPCVLEQMTEFGPDILTRLIQVKGVEHKKHVDLELVDSWDKINASDTITKTTNPPPPAAVTLEEQHEPMLDPVAAVTPCSHEHFNPQLVGNHCPECAEYVRERVG